MIKITRSFSQTKQVKAYEPVNSFCSAEMEVHESKVEEASKKLDEICRSEVTKTLMIYSPQGASQEEKKERVKEEAEQEAQSFFE